MTGLSISVFGFPAVQLAGHPISFATRKVQALLLYLAVESGAQPRETLAALLWPDYDTASSKASLRQTLALLKRTFEEWKDQIGTVVCTTRTTLTFNPTAMVSFDLLTLEQALAQLPSSAAAPAILDVAVLHRAVQAYRGDFLAGFFLDDAPEFEIWVSVQRERWHQQMHQVLAYLSEHYLVQRAFSEAREVARRWVAHDRWHEAAYRALMMAQWQVGDRSGALHTYNMCRQVLIDELGITPEAETEAVLEQIRTAVVSEPVISIPARVGGSALSLPPLPTVLPLIGRETEVHQVMKAIREAHGRLISVVGPPGVGKTHLADVVLRQVTPQFAKGGWRVDLSTIATADLVLEMLAQSLGCNTPEHATALERLIEALWQQRLVVLLDNMEQVLDAAVALDTLLAHCPQLVILVTSREPLRIRREHQIGLQPLAVPSTTADLAQLQASAAVQLFVQQLQKLQPEFVVTQDNKALVVRVCQQLDGLPLGLVLTASHGGVLPLEEMLARLEQSLPLPSLALRDVPVRHRSLHAAIAASYVLLDSTHRYVFRQLGVFAGSWTIEAAQAVIAAEHLAEPFLDVLASLVGHNLVQLVKESDPPRYRMLTTIRAYARAQLEQHSEAEATQYRYARYMMTLAEQADPHIRTSERQVWITRLEEEYDNLRGVLDHLVQVQDTDVALRLSVAMSTLWIVKGYISEAFFWFNQILALPGGTVQARIKTLNATGHMFRLSGDFVAASRYYNEALKLCDTPELAYDYTLILNNLGLICIEQGDLQQAERLISKSLERMHHGEYEPWRIAVTLNNVGIIAEAQKDYDRAQTAYIEALRINREIHNLWGMETAYFNLAGIAARQNKVGVALEYLSESLRLVKQLNTKDDIIYHIESIADLCFRSGLVESVIILFSVAEKLRYDFSVALYPLEYSYIQQVLVDLKDRLGNIQFESLWAEGQTMFEEDADTFLRTQLDYLHQLYPKEMEPNSAEAE